MIHAHRWRHRCDGSAANTWICYSCMRRCPGGKRSSNSFTCFRSKARRGPLDCATLRTCIRTCQQHGLGFLAYRPLASGLLSGKYSAASAPIFAPGDHRSAIYWFKGAEFARRQQVIERLRPVAQRAGLTLAALALAWVYSRPGVNIVLAGARTVEQVDQNLGGARRLEPDIARSIDAIVADQFAPARATPTGRMRYEAIAAAWTDKGDKPMIAAQVKVFVDRLAEQGLVT